MVLYREVLSMDVPVKIRRVSSLDTHTLGLNTSSLTESWVECPVHLPNKLKGFFMVAIS
jgi:hypothetical protein